MKLNGYYYGHDFENPRYIFTDENLHVQEISLGLIKLPHIKTEAIKGCVIMSYASAKEDDFSVSDTGIYSQKMKADFSK